MNLIYLIKSFIIVIIISYNVFIIEFYDFENLVIKFIAIFLNDVFNAKNN